MTDCTKLVEALRCELHYTSCPETNCKYICHDTFCDTYRLMIDAADAIEALLKENKELIEDRPELVEIDGHWEWRKSNGEVMMPKRGECVVRMEKPENCEKCLLRVNDSQTNVPNWICAINQWPTFYCKKSQNHADEDKYLQDCPIICSLPKGMGGWVIWTKIDEMPTASLWHRVEEELPDDSRDVIIFTVSGIIGIGSFIRPNWYQWYSGGGFPVDVTHWMPLPEPPKEDA